MPKENNIKQKLVGSLLAAFCVASAVAQPLAVRPRLVIGIVIDGLNQQTLQLLDGQLSDNGFKRLMREGAVFSNIEYGPGLDAVSAAAIVMTGASPAVNGVPSEYIYDPATRRTHPVFQPAEGVADISASKSSAANLAVSTVADEVRISAAGTGLVHSIASDASQAVILAGHAANGAVWINSADGRWTTSAYFGTLPTPAAMSNMRRPLSAVLDTLMWSPLLPLGEYPDIPSYKKPYPFKYQFKRGDKDRYSKFKASPIANSAVTDLALKYISDLKLGSREATDMLNLAYSVEPYRFGKETDNRVEAMDAYLRLDRDIARLIAATDSASNKQETLLFIAGTPATAASKPDDEQWRIPTGEFSSRKAVSLLNMYLIALHGNGQWVSGFHNRQMFLNRDAIKSANLDIRQLRNESAEFLSRMAGVSEVYTIDELLSGQSGENIQALRRNLSPKHAGDILLFVSPGWVTTDDDDTTVSANTKTVRMATAPSPFIVWGNGIKPSANEAPADARSIAPAIAHRIRIRAPNGAGSPPLRF